MGTKAHDDTDNFHGTMAFQFDRVALRGAIKNFTQIANVAHD